MAYDFDLVVIGGGAAGLSAAGFSASLGAKTALIEAQRLGGDCTWTGCVPSKTLLKAAKVAHTLRTADRYGLSASVPRFDFARVLAHVHTVQTHIYEEADAPHHFEKMGVKVLPARARFLDPHRLELSDEQGARSAVTARYFIIATGSRPRTLPVAGLDRVPYLTNETLFSFTALPERLVVVGAGPLGIEMAQAFRRLGSEVVSVSADPAILPRDDRELTSHLHARLEAEGIRFFLNSRLKSVEKTAAGVRVTAERPGAADFTVEGEALLLSVGRRADFAGLNLEAAGVAYNKGGIVIDARCRTAQKHIFACGDVTGRYQFTHMAEHMAKVAVSNALLRLPAKVEFAHVPWCTYTDPELAHVGASEEELQRRGTRYAVYRFPFTKLDRALTESETTGLIKVLARSLTGRIYGVSILGASAGEMIAEYALALRNRVTLRQLADTIHPYPTYGLGNRRAADQWYVRQLRPGLVRWLQRLFGYRGQLPPPPDPARIV